MKGLKKYLGCLLALALMLAMGACAPALAREAASSTAKAATVYVKKATYLYKSNRTTSKKLEKLPVGTAVTRLSSKGNWSKVRYDGQTGFVLRARLGAQPQEEQLKTIYLKKAAYLYKSNSTSSKKLKKLSAGEEISLYSTRGAWAKVLADGVTGFVKKSACTAVAPPQDAVEPPVQDEANGGAQDEADGAPQAQPSQYETLRPGDTGEAVKKLQTRLKELGWFYGDIGGNYLTQTTQAVKDFQSAAKLEQTGVADEKTQKALYASDAPKFSASGASTAKPAGGEVKEMDWWKSNISTLFARGSTAVVTDVKTGISWRVYRSGGTNHADVQPLTAADTAAMKKACGGKWSWDRRAIWVSIGDTRYAASMNCMPHGSGSITTNNFDGHHCIHFTNSRTHGTNRVCPLHQAAIAQALAAG